MNRDAPQKHRDYDKIVRIETRITDFLDEEQVKKKCLSSFLSVNDYLLIPIHYKDADGQWDKELFSRLVYHADMPEYILQNAIIQAVGVCFKQDATIELPDNLAYFQDELKDIATGCIKQLLTSGRFALFVDIDEKTGQPKIIQYDSKHIIDWDDENTFYTLVQEPDNLADRAMIIQDIDGSIVTQLWEKPSNEQSNFIPKNKWNDSFVGNWEKVADAVNRTTFKGLPLREMPVVYSCINPVLKGMAKSILKGFRQSAVYYSMIDTLGSGKLVIYTDSDIGEIVKGGHEAGLKLNKGDKAELLQLKSDGANVLREAMMTQFDLAVAQGLEIISEGANRASGENLALQVGNKQIKVTALADVVSESITKALKIAGGLLGLDTSDILYKLNVNLIRETVDTAVLKELREGAKEGYILPSDYVKALDSYKQVTVESNDDGKKDYSAYSDSAHLDYLEKNDL